MVAKRRIDTLVEERDENYALAVEEEKKAENLEQSNFSLRARIESLENQLQNKDISPDANIEFPETWDGFSHWCDKNFAGRLFLARKARQGVKKPQFNDPNLAGRCLKWLAYEYLKIRNEGGGDTKRNDLFDGIRDERCGGDAFDFDFDGTKWRADRHLKNGGNTRDPNHCLRIYFCYDDSQHRVIVADMPAHCRNKVS